MPIWATNMANVATAARVERAAAPSATWAGSGSARWLSMVARAARARRATQPMATNDRSRLARAVPRARLSSGAPTAATRAEIPNTTAARAGPPTRMATGMTATQPSPPKSGSAIRARQKTSTMHPT
jgi:hypothetical protein